MTSKKNKAALRKYKKRPNVLTSEKIEFIDYKDVNLLQRFMSDRSKIRARRMNGNTVQQQHDIATAVKNAREMALLPYTKRVAASREVTADLADVVKVGAVDAVDVVESSVDSLTKED